MGALGAMAKPQILSGVEAFYHPIIGNWDDEVCNISEYFNLLTNISFHSLHFKRTFLTCGSDESLVAMWSRGDITFTESSFGRTSTFQGISTKTIMKKLYYFGTLRNAF